ncbi:glycosyltransferase family 2 protein [Prosthecobacter sp.]|uniref:glycosyltransferase family 2 protein n=1 Tax=Prosthecobacter sp. TaxID=1965333 RepID=UPI0039048D4F
MQKPVVLVGIVTHNRAEILPKAVAAALAQRGCTVRVSVIDDGSTDGTAAVARQFPGVEWLTWRPNRGYMAARNQWMSTEGVDYFVSLDDDAWFLQEDEIALAVDYLESHPEAAAVAYDILSPDRPQPVQRGVPCQTAMFIGCGHVLKLSALRAVGLYEKTPGSYGGEEKDLCLRLLDAGSQVVAMPGVHVWHDKSAVARDVAFQHCSGVCNDLVMALRRSPLTYLLAALLSKTARHLFYSWRQGLVRPCLQGFGMFVQAIPEVLRSRRPVGVAALRTYMKLSRTSGGNQG